MMILVTGASASGKSAFAERLVEELGVGPRFYLATMIPWDEECRERIRKHRLMRAKRQFETIECPVDLGKVSLPEGSTALLECMSNLTANELYREDIPGNGPDMTRDRIAKGLSHLQTQARNLVVVTNEVFSDGEDYGPETERYRELLGSLNAGLARTADAVYEVVCGIPIKIKQERTDT